jgi:hypothetical protein
LSAAILAYSGASIYPYVYRNYSEAQKQALADSLRVDKLNKFVALAKILGAECTIPAAGSFVFGGLASGYTPHMHQATPSQILSHWVANGLREEHLMLMSPGDFVVLGTSSLKKSRYKRWRNYSHEDRVSYSKGLSQYPCDITQIKVPETIPIPWRSLICKARASMWNVQQRLSCYPEWDLFFIIKSSNNVPMKGEAQLCVRINLQTNNVDFLYEPSEDDNRPRIEFYFSSSLLLMVLTGATFWNVAEYHMEIYRSPDKFEPTISRLLSFFKV